MDPRVDGQLQGHWSWLIAAYLFLGGVGSGAYVTAAVSSWTLTGLATSTTVGLWISWTALLIGSLCLMADLGSPSKAVLAGVKVGTSWIARGFWIISLFMILAFVHMVLAVYTDFGTSASGGKILKLISWVGVLLAVCTMAYTGLLLGASKGIPFWRSGVVPVVFLASALATGHFTVMIGSALATDHIAVSELRLMALEAAVLVAFEVLAIFFFLQAAYKLPDSRESAERIMRRTAFVVGYFILGLGVPLVLMVVVFRTEAASSSDGLLATAVVGAALGLIGGLILRHSVLVVGTLPTWNIAGFKFRRIPQPKAPKPHRGLLPPS